MLTVTLTKGLPGSGKSTWAKQQVLNAPNGSTKRVNKDDLRAMLDVGRWSKTNEQFVLKVRDFVIIEALLAGKHVIVDDTNLEDSHYNRIVEAIDNTPELNTPMFKNRQIKVQYKDFTDVPLDVCIERDIKRANGVGEKVIRDMYDRYLAPPPTTAPFNLDLPDAIITDVDGTTAFNNGHRGWYDHDKVGNDEPIDHIINLIKRYEHDHKIIVVSARSDICYDATLAWLNKHGLFPHILLMRKDKDMRKDEIIKRELYESEIKDKYNIRFVLDDRNGPVKLWRSLGIPCLQCAEGDF